MRTPYDRVGNALQTATIDMVKGVAANVIVDAVRGKKIKGGNLVRAAAVSWTASFLFNLIYKK